MRNPIRALLQRRDRIASEQTLEYAAATVDQVNAVLAAADAHRPTQLLIVITRHGKAGYRWCLWDNSKGIPAAVVGGVTVPFVMGDAKSIIQARNQGRTAAIAWARRHGYAPLGGSEERSEITIPLEERS